MNLKTQVSPTRRPTSVARRLGLCAATLAGSFAMVTHASAAIVTFNTPISVPNNFDGVYLNFLTGATGTSSATAGWDFNPYNSGVSLSFFWSASPSQAGGVASTTTGPYVDLAPGAVVSAASTFAAVTATANTAPFQSIGTHTLGFRFYNEATAAINYGYATLTTAGTTGFPLTISRWSFENTGAAITVPSAVPEPSTGALLSLGALALGALNLRKVRRQRQPLVG